MRRAPRARVAVWLRFAGAHVRRGWRHHARRGQITYARPGGGETPNAPPAAATMADARAPEEPDAVTAAMEAAMVAAAAVQRVRARVRRATAGGGGGGGGGGRARARAPLAQTNGARRSFRRGTCR